TRSACRQGAGEEVPDSGRLRARRGGAGQLLDGLGECDLDRLGRRVGEDARGAGETEIAHEQRCRWSGRAAQALQPNPDLDERRRERQLGSQLELVTAVDDLEVGAVKVGET